MSLRTCLFGHLIVSLLFAFACGPEAPMATDGSTSGTTTTTTSGSATAPTTSTIPDPTASPTTTEDSAGSTTEAAPFIVPPDACGLVSGGELGLRCSPWCSVWDQDCARGQKCVPYSSDGDETWDSERCAPIAADPGQPGEPCSFEGNVAAGVDTCDRGVVCWHLEEDSLQGTCVAMCKGSIGEPICDDSTTACASTLDGLLNLCLPACDPLAPGCAAEELCVSFGGDFICTPDASGDEGQVFDPCESVNGCDPGLFCADSVSANECDPLAGGCCLPFCDLDLPPDCPGALQQCQSWFEPGEAPPGHEDLGGCVLPP